MQRMPFLVERNGGNERHFVLRSTPRFAGVNAAKVGIVGSSFVAAARIVRPPRAQTVSSELSFGADRLDLWHS